MTEHPLLLSAPMVRALQNTAIGVWPAKAIDASKPFKWQTRRLVKKLRVRLRHEVRSDPGVFDPRIVAPPGIYDATMHRQGAMSIDVAGKRLGVGVGEFDFVCPYSSGTTTLTTHGDYRKGTGGAHWEVQPGDGVWFRETYGIATNCIVYRADVGTPAWPDAVAVPRASRWKPSIFLPREYCRLTGRIRRLRLEFLQDITTADIGAEGMPVDYSVNDRPDTLEFEQRLAFREGWDRLNKHRAPFDTNPLVWVIDFERTR